MACGKLNGYLWPMLCNVMCSRLCACNTCHYHLQAVTTNPGNGQLQTVAPVFPTAVAVIDSGVQCNHPDLHVVFTKQFNSERSPDPNRDGGCYDGLGHSTHVSGMRRQP
jgi:hypothetical protein